MPATFLYLMVATIYISTALLLLCVAVLMAIVPSLRHSARWLALGILGSFPGVLFFQVLVLPCVWVIFIPIVLLFGGQTLTRPIHITITLGAVLLMIVTFAVASLYGFIFGWRAANALYARNFHALLTTDPVFRRLLQHRIPLVLGSALVYAIVGVQFVRFHAVH
jgi:hypothetical protein